MPLKNIKLNNKSAAAVELCLDEPLVDWQINKMTLEQEIEQLFEQFREPIFRYLVATFGSRRYYPGSIYSALSNLGQRNTD